jgi:choline dehydrogenase-like flavoprotein
VIVGSGFAATAMALRLAEAGIDVDIFEKGPAYPHPATPLYADLVERSWRDPGYEAAPDLASLTADGVYRLPLNEERAITTGGCGTHWAGIALRMRPSDFRTRTDFGFGVDWPVQYEELEPYYGTAEQMVGVAGTDADNPYAPRRSTPYPLPQFELGAADLIMAERLRSAGVVLHTTPQARTRHAFDGRPACQNFGVCHVCPIGARYAPNHHLDPLVAAGSCTLHTDTSVRRIITDARGQATGLLVQHADEAEPREVPARWVVIAAGALESARLLLLSTGGSWPEGLGNRTGHLGSGLCFHHCWRNNFSFREDVFAGRFGGFTGQSHQFLDPPERGRHGGIKVEFGIRANAGSVRTWGSWDVVEPQIVSRRRSWPIVLCGESTSSPSRRVTLSHRADRFGDPFAHVHYELLDFDLETFAFAREVHDRFASGVGAEPTELPDDPHRFGSGAHHMGGCAMSRSAEDGVADAFGRVHGCTNVYIAGSSLFPGSSGAVNPTLTLVALAFRSAEHLVAAFHDEG